LIFLTIVGLMLQAMLVSNPLLEEYRLILWLRVQSFSKLSVLFLLGDQVSKDGIGWCFYCVKAIHRHTYN